MKLKALPSWEKEATKTIHNTPSIASSQDRFHAPFRFSNLGYTIETAVLYSKGFEALMGCKFSSLLPTSFKAKKCRGSPKRQNVHRLRAPSAIASVRPAMFMTKENSEKIPTTNRHCCMLSLTYVEIDRNAKHSVHDDKCVIDENRNSTPPITAKTRGDPRAG